MPNPVNPPGAPPLPVVPKGIVWELLDGSGSQLSAVCGESETAEPGIWGLNDKAGPGVLGDSTSSQGVRGTSQSGEGVAGMSSISHGVHGINGPGATEKPDKGCGVWGESAFGLGVAGYSEHGWGIVGQGGVLAGYFVGDVTVTGNINLQKDCVVTGNVNVQKGGDVILANQDCAEDFDVLGAEEIHPGSVVVIDSDGLLKQSDRSYDKRVAGVVSGAGNYKPAIILGRQQLEANKMPVALMGRVYCKVDARYFPIEVGDLLTTSPTPGHAMKADDPIKAFGAVIGKALCSVEAGQGLIPILVALQ